MSESIEHLRKGDPLIGFVDRRGLLKEDGEYYIVVRRGDSFHTEKCDPNFFLQQEGFLGGAVVYNPNAIALGDVYLKIHPSMTVALVEGATIEEDDGTHWHFHKASPLDHHLLEAETKGMLIAHFQPHINGQNLEIHKAGDITARTLEVNKQKHLQQVMDDALTNVETEVRKLWQGQHVHEGKHDYARETAAAAVTAALATLVETAKTDPIANFNKGWVTTEATKVFTALTATRTVETWAQRVARVAVEEAAKKAKEGGADAE